MKINVWLSLMLLLMAGSIQAQEEGHDDIKGYQLPKDKQVADKITQWQDLKFGLFMHWGTYSQWGIVESWTLSPEDYAFCKRNGPYADNYFTYKKAYENLQTVFNPTQFNPEKWAEAAQLGGMKYMVFTAKHHDGFCMFDTKYTDYKITGSKSPYASNPNSNITKAIFDAFRKKNFMVGAYFSKPDWHSEDFWWSYFPPTSRLQNYDIKKYPERWKRFAEFTYNQIEELMTGYGKVDLLWLDGDWAKIDMAPIATMARKNQPGLIMVDRHGPAEYVNYLTPEQKIPTHFISVPWETCMTMGKSWSYDPNEKYRPTRELIQKLVDIVAKNGNLLLDIGPGPDGEWHPVAYERLKEMGRWLQTNGESIYGTKPVMPYRKDKWAFTGNGKALFASYLPADKETDLPAVLSLQDSLITVPANATITLLGTQKSLKWAKNGSQVDIQIPEATRVQLSNQPVWVFRITGKNK
jgi:alpha-L-fucosidase